MSVEDFASFTYSSQPHSAPVKLNKKYKSDTSGENDLPLTLMSDPRVVRGSTHSLARKITQAKSEFPKSTRSFVMKMKPTQSFQSSRATYSFEVKPFSNSEIDVLKNLVSQNDFPIRNNTMDTQTDAFIHRPDSPDYIPAKIGVDIATQVENVEDLFDFDKEVIPILEVVVQKTIDQALYEVRCEDELISLEEAAKGFRIEKFQGDEWMALLQENAIKENRERRERIQTLQTAKENEIKTKTVIAGLQMARQILPHAQESILTELLKDGKPGWQEIDRAIAEQQISSSLIGNVGKFLDTYSVACGILDEILCSTEQLYTSCPTYYDSSNESPRTMTVTICFKKRNEEEFVQPKEEEEEDGIIETQAFAKKDEVTVMTVLVGPQDSLESLERRIRAEVHRLRKLTSNSESASSNDAKETDEIDSMSAQNESANEGARFDRILPDTAALESLSSDLYKALSMSLPPYLLVSEKISSESTLRRDLAIDGVLWNYPFPKFINVDMII